MVRVEHSTSILSQKMHRICRLEGERSGDLVHILLFLSLLWNKIVIYVQGCYLEKSIGRKEAKNHDNTYVAGTA
jgi:hypothetical protein